MIREADRTNGEWVRLNVGVDYPFPTLPEHEVSVFPYAEMEVKLADSVSPERILLHVALSNNGIQGFRLPLVVIRWAGLVAFG